MRTTLARIRDRFSLLGERSSPQLLHGRQSKMLEQYYGESLSHAASQIFRIIRPYVVRKPFQQGGRVFGSPRFEVKINAAPINASA